MTLAWILYGAVVAGCLCVVVIAVCDNRRLTRERRASRRALAYIDVYDAARDATGHDH